MLFKTLQERRMTEHLTDLDAATDWLLQRVDGPLRIGADRKSVV